MGKLHYLRNVVTLELDRKRCIGCGICLSVCPHGVFMLHGDKAVITERDACMECGACMMNCPVTALRVERGVGCAQAVINTMLGRTGRECCSLAPVEAEERSARRKDSSCC